MAASYLFRSAGNIHFAHGTHWMIHACITKECITLDDFEFSHPQALSAFSELLGTPSRSLALPFESSFRFRVYDDLGIVLWDQGGLIGGVEFVITQEPNRFNVITTFNGRLEVGNVRVTAETLERELACSSVPFQKIECGYWRYKVGYRFITFDSLGRIGSSGRRLGRPRYVTRVSAHPGQIASVSNSGEGRTRRST